MAGLKFSRKKKQGGGSVLTRGKMPSKRTINLAQIGVERIDPKLAAAGIILIILVAGLFSKFLVIDRLAAMSRANSEMHALERELEAEYAKIAGFGGLEEEYAHYTYAGMTQEELSLVDRARIINMIQRETENTENEISWSVTGNTLILTVAGRDLQEINQMARRLEEYPIVNTCTVTTAPKEDIQRVNSSSAAVYGDNVVRANITVYLQNETEVEGK